MNKIVNFFLVVFSVTIFSGCSLLEEGSSLQWHWKSYLSMFEGDWFDIAVGIIVSLLVLYILLIFLCALLWAINYAGVKSETGLGLVVDKNHEKVLSSSYLVPTPAIGIGFTAIHRSPADDYILKINVSSIDQTDEFSVSKKIYDQYNKGDRVKVEYALGRLDHGMLIRSLTH